MASKDIPTQDGDSAEEEHCGTCRFTEYKCLSHGHTKCAFHRPYTGAKYWEPDNCPKCLETIAKIKKESDPAYSIQLSQVRTFLDLTKHKIELKDPHKLWEYKPIFEYIFIRAGVSEPTQGSSNSGVAGYKMADDAGDVTITQPDRTPPGEDTDSEFKPSPPQSSVNPKCSSSICVKENDEAQCQDPVHGEEMDIESHETLDADSDSSSQAPIIKKRKPNDKAENLSLLPSIQRTPKAKRYEKDKKHTPMSPYDMPQQVSHTDESSKETWIQFNPRLHERIGWNVIKIKSKDASTGHLTGRVSQCIYNSTARDWFKLMKPDLGPQLFIDDKTAHLAFKSSFRLKSSTLLFGLTSATSLDSAIPEESELSNMLYELKDMDKRLTKALVYLKIDDFRALFDVSSCNFSTHSVINFTSGFPLSDHGFQSFSKDKYLDIPNFDRSMGDEQANYPAHNQLLSREKEARLNMAHTLGTIHLMEMLVNQVALVSEDLEDPSRLSTNAAKGIAKRLLVNVKNDTIRWMTAKMEVRLSLLYNKGNLDVVQLLRSTLWCPDIFPKRNIQKLKAKYPGVSNLKTFLNTEDGSPDPTDQDPAQE